MKQKEWNPYFTETIYAIRHNPTGKIYIGRTNRLAERIQTHLSALKGNRHHVERMQDDCNRYGFDYSLFVLDDERSYSYDKHKSESYYQLLFGTRDPERGYNYKEIPHNDNIFSYDEYRIPHEYNDYFLDPRFKPKQGSKKSMLKKEVQHEQP